MSDAMRPSVSLAVKLPVFIFILILTGLVCPGVSPEGWRGAGTPGEARPEASAARGAQRQDSAGGQSTVFVSELFTPAKAQAAGPTCHCFRDRDFNPANPAASDPYLLATASNTLLAAVAGIPRREVVQALMSGTSGDDLWIAAHAARLWREDPRTLLRSRGDAPSWPALLSAHGGLERLGRGFVAALEGGAGDAALARLAVADVLAERVGTPRAELGELLARGATRQEMVAASLIGLWARRPAPEILATATAAGGSWSGPLAAAGKNPTQMETAVPAALRPEAAPKGLGGDQPPR